MAPILVPFLSFIMVMCFGMAIVLTIANRRRIIRERLMWSPPRPMAESAPGSTRTAGLLGSLGQLVSHKGPSHKLQRSLTQAGFSSSVASMIFLGSKVVFLAIGAVAAMLYYLIFSGKDGQSSHLLVICMSAAAFSYLPNFYIYRRRMERTMEIRHHLPDAVDLLEICVSAGMGLDMAWNMVADEIRAVSSRLADEMALTNLEMHLGVSRTEAMRHMTERTGAEELASLVAVLVQSERFGTSIGEVLRVFAMTMRELRSQRAEESAEKMAVKLLFPMVVFIFPAILIVTAGPAGIIMAEIMLVK